MAQAPTTPVHHDAPKKTVGEPGLVMPLADPGPLKPTPTIGVKGEAIEDGERDPDTIAEEQRRRSDETEAARGKDLHATNKAPLPPPEHHQSKK
jgi:hypothetical protein